MKVYFNSTFSLSHSVSSAYQKWPTPIRCEEVLLRLWSKHSPGITVDPELLLKSRSLGVSGFVIIIFFTCIMYHLQPPKNGNFIFFNFYFNWRTNPFNLCNKCWSIDSNLKWTPCSNPDKVSCRTAGVRGGGGAPAISVGEAAHSAARGARAVDQSAR